ncbi:polysaccharide deacetylase [Mesorhizobium loti]|nr:polysaccharide deacetylase [Mesorhizobium loti]PLP60347.1 polysaccharide deacetylase [Mesorhizobium loti]
MTRHIACLSFDFDAWSGLTARGLTTPTPVSRGEFCAVAVPRILKLLERHAIPSTFFIPGIVIETYPELTRQIHDAGHEVGNHGWTHFPPSTLDPADEERDLLRSSDLIETITGRRPTGYRSASFDLSPVTAQLLEKHGFLYESSMMGHDHSPYYIRIGDKVDPKERLVFGRESDLVELPVSWNLDDFPHFEFLRTPQQLMPGLQWAGGVLENWVDDFRYMHQTEQWGALIFTFHPYVIGRGHRMIMLEKLINALEGMGAIWQTMEATALEFKGRSRR